MKIKDYLDKIQNKTILNNNLIINNSECNKHEEEYRYYCRKCKMNICSKCLKSREHFEHFKLILIEIEPEEKELKEIKNLIKNNNNKIKNILIIF